MKIPGLWCCTRECCPPCSCNIIFGTPRHHQQISVFIITANCNRSEAGLIVWPALCVDMAEWVSGPYPPWTNQFISPQVFCIPWCIFCFSNRRRKTTCKTSLEIFSKKIIKYIMNISWTDKEDFFRTICDIDDVPSFKSPKMSICSLCPTY